MDTDITLTREELRAAHDSLDNHSPACLQKCLLEVWYSLHPERRVVKEGERHIFSGDSVTVIPKGERTAGAPPE